MPTFIHKDGQQIGPLADARIVAGLWDRTYSPDDLAWREGMAQWQPLRRLYPDAPLPPPPPPDALPRRDEDPALRFVLPVGRSGWAIAAGYLGLFSFLLLPAPLALLVSLIAIRDIRRSRATDRPKHGMGRAIFGLILGVLGTVALALLLIQIGSS